MKTNYNVKLTVIVLVFICMLLPYLGQTQSIVLSVSPDNCMNPTPNSGTYTASGTMNGKNMYVKGANLRIIWSGTQWQVQGDDPSIGGVSWVTAWVNSKDTPTPPADCWTSSFGCFIPTFSGPDAFPVVTVTITAVDPSPSGNATVNYTATFSGTINSLTASNFSLNTTGVTGASITGVTQTTGNVWNIAVGTGSGNGTIQLSLTNTTGASATICTLPKTGPTYIINHNTAPVFVNGSPQTLSVCQNSGATDIKPLLHVNDPDASQTETWSQASAPANGTLSFSSATASSGSTNITPGGTITYTPNAGFTGTDAFTVQVSDGTATATTTVNVTVNAITTITGTTPGSRCGTGTVTLGATASSGTLNWYASSTGGSSLGTGTSFTTPVISATTTYYVDVTNNGCTSARTAVVATVNTTPTITGTTPGSRCGTGTVTLGATASAGTLNWYASSTGGSSLGTGTSFTTPVISSTTTYYVDATNSGCTSSRTAVVATVNTTPTITGTTPGSRCGTGTVTLGASASAGTLSWYAAPTGGSSLGTGTSFTTPVISSTTTYYVEATNSGCTSSRTAVVATINAIPTITGTTPGSRCGTGTVTLGASASAGTLNWYAASTGGSSLGIGTSFTTPGISSTTTYYVDVTNAGCTSSRSAVLATVHYNPNPVIVTGGPTTFCNGDSVVLTASGSGNALTFDGTNDYVDCGSGINTVFAGTNMITVEAWVNTSSGQNLQTITGNYNGSMQFLLRIDNMKPVFWVSNGSFSNATGATTVPQNTWVHIAGTWDGTTIKVYYNGVLDGSNAFGGNLPSVTQPLRIGASLLSEMFSGSIDEVRIWNMAKTQTEIQSSMNGVVATNAAGLAGYYKLNEGTGTTTADATVNANNGTLINGPTWMIPSTSPADAVTYLWSPNGETTKTIAAKTSGNYFVTYTSTQGCSGSSSGIVVTVKNNTYATDAQTACSSFTWMDGNTYTTSNNTATYIIPNAAGCDSIITLNLTLSNPSDQTVTAASSSLCAGDSTTIDVSSTETAVKYYLRDNSNNTIIDGPVTGTGSNISFNTGPINSSVTYNVLATNDLGAVDLPGSLDYVKFNAPFYTYGNEITVESWVNFDGSSHPWAGQSQLDADNSGSNVWLWHAGTFYVNYGGSWRSLLFPTTVPTGWTHVATVANPACLSIYYNGVLVAYDSTASASSVQNSASSVITLGQDPRYSLSAGRNSNRAFDNFAVWKSARTQAEVLIDMNACLTGTETNLVQYTKFNDKSGSSISSLTGASGTIVNPSANWITGSGVCDIVCDLQLTNTPGVTVLTTSSSQTATACDIYNWNGNAYIATGTYMDTIPNAAGCDSIMTLNLTITNSTSSTDVQSACDTYTWMDGITYTSSNNTATYTIPNAAGCDSVITLDLTIINSTSSTDVQSACDTYTWMDGITYTSSNNTATYTIPNAAGCDSVITLDLTIINSTSSTDVQSACDNFTWIDGITYTSSNNTATYTVPNAAGCDSVITLNLTINTVDASVTSMNETITASASGASYQWLDCSNAYSVISGETNQSFTASINGDYAVEVTENGCTDTSACTLITTVSVTELSSTAAIEVYPNPANDILYVNLDVTSAGRSLITITNAAGQTVYTESTGLVSGENTLHCNVNELARGIYFVQVTTSEKVFMKRIVLQ